MYNFDELVSRKATRSIKWDEMAQHFSAADEETLPLWVADMDFRSPDEIIRVLTERAKHGVYGYTSGLNEYFETVKDWMAKKHNWEIEKEWIVYTPGIVMALNALVQTFTDPGDKVLIQTPVYPPFHSVVTENGRQLVENPLNSLEGVYTMDFEDLASKIDESVKMMILCSPHNPVGRVWTKEELEKVINICEDHGVLIVADEIHADLLFEGVTHYPIASISKEASERIITCTAPSKTFNIAGLKMSNIIIPNKLMREKFSRRLQNLGIGEPNIFGVEAGIAAYSHGSQWLEEVMRYIQANYDYLVGYIERELPEVKVTRMEGTYLAWLDFSEVPLSHEAIASLLVEEGKVALNSGLTYGDNGRGFFRLNFACPRPMLEEGLSRIKRTLVR